jgi:hypothetical protein
MLGAKALAMANDLGQVVTNMAAKCQPLPLLTRIPSGPTAFPLAFPIDIRYFPLVQFDRRYIRV